LQETKKRRWREKKNGLQERSPGVEIGRNRNKHQHSTGDEKYVGDRDTNKRNRTVSKKKSEGKGRENETETPPRGGVKDGDRGGVCFGRVNRGRKSRRVGAKKRAPNEKKEFLEERGGEI